jgi:predicted GIY-YIG superfamily endonuclease
MIWFAGRMRAQDTRVSWIHLRYCVHPLVWFEDPTSAMAREKEIKKWRRDWKIDLIERSKPN